jgi:hypothetical protein
MNETSLREILAQASDSEAVELLQQTLRQSVRMALYEAMEQEVMPFAELNTSSPRVITSELAVKMEAATLMAKESQSNGRE